MKNNLIEIEVENLNSGRRIIDVDASELKGLLERKKDHAIVALHNDVEAGMLQDFKISGNRVTAVLEPFSDYEEKAVTTATKVGTSSVSLKEQRKRIVDGIQKEKSCDRFTAWNQARRKHPRLFAAAA